ncbi:MAG: hypothetical protein AAFR58_22540 [Cyanobacteria bacterium J06627_28]
MNRDGINKYALGGVILGIFLLSIFGIQSAFTRLSSQPNATGQSANNNAQTSRVNGNLTIEDGGLAEDIQPNENTRSVTGDNGQPTAEPFALTTLETAGTYIQRQKSIETDQVVANTSVDVKAATNNTATATQSDSRVTQPTAQTSQPASQERPASAAPASTAVPALW